MRYAVLTFKADRQGLAVTKLLADVIFTNSVPIYSRHPIVFEDEAALRAVSTSFRQACAGQPHL